MRIYKQSEKNFLSVQSVHWEIIKNEVTNIRTGIKTTNAWHDAGNCSHGQTEKLKRCLIFNRNELHVDIQSNLLI